ncbi:hypothetical protein RHMOL_Rhmol11G0170900 [Rhododendron molle]|uniref:Uncharacterized protein n=1 Tax=Rhododendron molle TaxID=49168 RepID=A0ACC0LTQ1_RHOML|nr:hypothetical protein RHMOL_Rhmol11G0170900 [Rhododendron molle]
MANQFCFGKICGWATPHLALAFPSLFCILNHKDERLCEVLARKAELQQWDSISEEGCTHDWEREQLNELINLRNESGVTTSTNTPDKLVWQGSNSGIFSVKSIYNLAASSHVNQDDTFDLIWKMWLSLMCDALAG